MNASVTTALPRGARIVLLTGGLVSVAFGIAVLAWPTKAAVALTVVIAFYAVIAGIVYVAMSIVFKEMGVGGRIGHALLGLLYIAAGIIAFTSLQQSAVFLAIFITIMVGLLWIIEGITSLFALGGAASKALTIIFAIISVLAGITLVISPLWGAAFLWWFLGIVLVVLGVLNVIRGIVGKRD